MEIGEKVTREKLIADGWNLVKAIARAACEIWSKDTLKIIWRVKTETIYTIVDKSKK